jgi:uncharacterized membrane protein YGL010W
MKSLNAWFRDYEASHRNHTNVQIHIVCVPLIALTLLGAFASLPWPFSFRPIGGWALLLSVLALVFYASLSWRAFMAMLVFTAAALSLYQWLLDSYRYVLPITVLVFAIAWIGQFVGHKLEGRKPSFLQDLLFLLIGPLFVLEHLGLPLEKKQGDKSAR